MAHFKGMLSIISPNAVHPINWKSSDGSLTESFWYHGERRLFNNKAHPCRLPRFFRTTIKCWAWESGLTYSCLDLLIIDTVLFALCLLLSSVPGPKCTDHYSQNYGALMVLLYLYWMTEACTCACEPAARSTRRLIFWRSKFLGRQRGWWLVMVWQWAATMRISGAN